MKGNDICKVLLGFVVGAGVGSGVTVLVTKNYFAKKAGEFADQQIAEMEAYYGRADSYARAFGDPGTVNPEEEEGHDPQVLSKDVMREMSRTRAEQTDYTKCFNKEGEGPGAEMSPEDLANAEHDRTKNLPPKVISADQAGELSPHIEDSVLYYYTNDECLTDEDDNYVDEPHRLVGDCLQQIDFKNSDEDIVYVLNYALDTCYEIQKIRGSFHDVLREE